MLATSNPLQNPTLVEDLCVCHDCISPFFTLLITMSPSSVVANTFHRLNRGIDLHVRVLSETNAILKQQAVRFMGDVGA